MTARDDAIDSRLRAVAQAALTELGRAPGYERDVPTARRHGLLRTITVAAGLAAAVGVGGAAIGVGLHNAGQHNTPPGPAGSPTPSATPTPSPTSSPIPLGTLGNDLLYTVAATDPTATVTNVSLHDWTWAPRGQVNLPEPYAVNRIVASPHGARLLLVKGTIIGFTDYATSPVNQAGALTVLTSSGQASSLTVPSGQVLTSIPRWADDESAVCVAAGKGNGTPLSVSSDHVYVLEPGAAPRQTQVNVGNRIPQIRACGASSDTMVVSLLSQGDITGALPAPEEIDVVRMSTGAVIRTLTMPAFDSNAQMQASAVASADGKDLARFPSSASTTHTVTVEDSATGRTLGTVDSLAVWGFTGLDSTIVGADSSGTVLVNWQTGQKVASAWLAQQSGQVAQYMVHAGAAELLVQTANPNPGVYIVDAAGQEHKQASSLSVLLVPSA